MKKNKDLSNFTGGLFGIIIALASLLLSSRIKVPEDSGFFDLTAAFFPRLFSVIIIMFGVYLVVANMPTKLEIRKITKNRMKATVKKIADIRKVLLGLVIVMYIYSLPIVGYIISTSLLLIISVILFKFNTKIEWFIFIPFVIFFPIMVFFDDVK